MNDSIDEFRRVVFSVLLVTVTIVALILLFVSASQLLLGPAPATFSTPPPPPTPLAAPTLQVLATDVPTETQHLQVETLTQQVNAYTQRVNAYQQEVNAYTQHVAAYKTYADNAGKPSQVTTFTSVIKDGFQPLLIALIGVILSVLGIKAANNAVLSLGAARMISSLAQRSAKATPDETKAILQKLDALPWSKL